MKSIKETVITEFEVSKSIFVNYLIPVTSVEQVNTELEQLKKTYPDANHHCFCYIIGTNQDIQKYSDDGEPSKTAGLPMLEVLKKHVLTNVLNVSIRYFGGIKLGAGGLVRAYTKSVSNGVVNCQFTTRQILYQIQATIPFDSIGQVEKFIRDQFPNINTTYDTLVHYTFDILESEFELFSNSMQERTNGKAIIDIQKEFERYI